MTESDRLAVALHRRDDGVTVSVRVVPRAPRTECVGLAGGALKVKLSAPPVDGAANDALRRWLADLCGCRPSEVEVLVGERSRDKVVLVRDVEEADVLRALRSVLR
jgi:uncharacterized protein